jgi:hypothetical protein
MTARVLEIDPRTFRRHPIHGDDRIWAETNCYVDIWVELTHAFGCDPVAALPFTVAIDFEGDQWTFFKFPLSDLYELYGFDVHELALWRSPLEHIEEQLGRGCPVLIELDSYYLPDTAGTAYRLAHVKTTVAATDVDADARRLGYFHGQGYYTLEGEDFANVLRLGERDAALLPPYAEIVKRRGVAERGSDALVGTSLALLRRHLDRAPRENPFAAFKARLERDSAGLLQESLETFHQYSFATVRQFGSCFELTATYLQWLSDRGQDGLGEARQDFLAIAQAAKAFQFQLARSMARRKSLDLSPLDAMAGWWQDGMARLKARFPPCD